MRGCWSRWTPDWCLTAACIARLRRRGRALRVRFSLRRFQGYWGIPFWRYSFDLGSLSFTGTACLRRGLGLRAVQPALTTAPGRNTVDRQNNWCRSCTPAINHCSRAARPRLIVFLGRDITSIRAPINWISVAVAPGGGVRVDSPSTVICGAQPGARTETVYLQACCWAAYCCPTELTRFATRPTSTWVLLSRVDILGFATTCASCCCATLPRCFIPIGAQSRSFTLGPARRSAGALAGPHCQPMPPDASACGADQPACPS